MSVIRRLFGSSLDSVDVAVATLLSGMKFSITIDAASYAGSRVRSLDLSYDLGEQSIRCRACSS